MWEVKEVIFDSFKLDGGAMFGVVPKTLWSKIIPSDTENRISMVTRCLILSNSERLVLIDCGCGSKWNEKMRSIYQIQNFEVDIQPTQITDVLITHLHFDHCGGLTKFEEGNLISTFPNAKIWVSRKNFEYALNPSPREKASYIPENFEPIRNQIFFIESEGEVFEGITCHFSDGHTTGMMWFEIQTKDGYVFYPSDLMPTSAHKRLIYTMGYDMCTTKLLEEKMNLIKLIKEKNARVVFEHDSTTPSLFSYDIPE